MTALIECLDAAHHRILYEWDGEFLLNGRGQRVTRCQDSCEAERFISDFLGYAILTVVRA